jgi:hypothetical protein
MNDFQARRLQINQTSINPPDGGCIEPGAVSKEIEITIRDRQTEQNAKEGAPCAPRRWLLEPRPEKLWMIDRVEYRCRRDPHRRCKFSMVKHAVSNPVKYTSLPNILPG